MQKEIPAEIAAFQGKRVKVTPTSSMFVIGGKKHCITDYHLYQDDPVIVELAAAVKAVGAIERFWTPGTVGTMDYRTDRLNIYIDRPNGEDFEITRMSWG